MRFSGTSKALNVAGAQALPGRDNYLLGTERGKWITGIPTYAQVRYRNLYPGIDLVFHGQSEKARLEHDFIVAPHADPGRIAFGFGNSEPMRITPDGKLVIGDQDHQLVFDPPQAWQTSGSRRVAIASSFVLRNRHTVTFRVGSYDSTRPLIIDPVLQFATYLDGSAQDSIADIATDPDGNVYVTGWTSSIDFPTSNAEQSKLSSAPDAFIAKLDPTLHTLLYSTYLGGSNSDQGQSIAVDASGNVAVSGISMSRDFPAAGKLSSTISTYTATYNFLASLNSDGSALRYSGFVGETMGTYDDYNPRLNRVAFDTQGNVYMTGTTQDPTYPYTSGAYGGPPAPYPADETVFILKAATDGTILYGATIPETPPAVVGSGTHRIDVGGLAVDSNGEAVIGGTSGNDLPVTSGALASAYPNGSYGIAGYVLKLNAAGSNLVFSTYLPGTDTVEGIALDAAGDVYASGSTEQANLPTSASAFQSSFGTSSACGCWDGYIFKLSSDGTQAQTATYFNGPIPTLSQYPNPATLLRDIRVDSAGNVAVGGLTGATNLPLKNPLTSVYGSLGLSTVDSTMLVARFSGDLSTLQFSSFLNAPDDASGFSALTLDPQDHILVAGITESRQFPTTAGVFQGSPPAPANSYTISNNQFIASVDPSVSAPSLCFDTTSVPFGTILVNTSIQREVNVTNCGNAALTLGAVQSSSPFVTQTNDCTAISPGAACNIQLTFTPTALGPVQGTLSISGNMSISPQFISFAGTGGAPSVSFPPSITFNDLLVGQTGALAALGILNRGNAQFILSNASITGDFQITNNTCSSPVPPNGSCQIVMNFSPTGAGTRTGSLTLTDNLTPATQVVQLTGNGLTTAPVPAITYIPAVPAIASGTGQVIVSGKYFFPNSVVYWNGAARTTHYGGEYNLVADLTAADLQQLGEASVTVNTPAPGGGTSNAYTVTIYGRIQNIQVLHELYDSATGLLYATVSNSSSTDPNSLVAIDPATLQVTKTLLTGGKPDALAISDDGSLLYVGLDSQQSVTQLSLPAGTANFTVKLPATPDSFLSASGIEASALAVVPGKPHTWIAGLCYINVSPCGGGAAVFDDSTQRPTTAYLSQLTANSFAFVNDPSIVYSTQFNQSPPSVSSYSISSTGISVTATSTFDAAAGGSALTSDGSLLYAASGQVIDPSTLTVKFDYPQGGQGLAFDKADSRLFFAGRMFGYSGGLNLVAVDKDSKATIGSIGFQEYGSVSDVQRFGAKGIVINAGTQLLFVQTSLAAETFTSPQVTASPSSLSFGGQAKGTSSDAQTVTLNNGSSVALNISAIQAYAFGIGSGTDFAQTNTCPKSLAAGSSCTISVTFSPTTENYETGQLTISDDAVTGNQVVPLDGTGVPPGTTTYNAVVAPASLIFPSQGTGTTSSAQPVTLSNTGTGTLSISNIAATGDFAESNNCGTSLAAGASCTINVTFTPTANGNRTGQLTISDNATTSPQTVALSGTAATPLTLAPSASGGNSVTVASGATATYSLLLTSNNYAGTVALSCTGAPAYATCAVNPSSTTLSSGQNTSVTVTVTTASTTQASIGMPHPSGLRLANFGWLALVALPLLFSMRRRAIRVGLVALLAAALWTTTGCGGGGGGGSTAPPPITHNTSPGTYTLTVTATAGNVSSTEQLTLVVQ
ncbi:MAG TPA: choice-of-anchor D domain-containing protein [Terracidiphilus sp.]|nr:choice-of-anchor D domain-containing protein [Terracidiphilus sp.]